MSKLPRMSKLPGPSGRAPERTVQSLTRTTSSSTIVTTIATTRVPSTSRAGQPGAGYGLPQPPRTGGRMVTAPTPGARGRVPARTPAALPARTPASAQARILAALPPPRPGPSVSQPRPVPGLRGPAPVYQKRTLPRSFGYGMPGPSSAVPGPTPKMKTTTSSKTEIRGGKKIKTTKTTTSREPSTPYQELPQGRYMLPQPMMPGAGPRQMRQRGLEGFRAKPETTMPDPRRQLRKPPSYSGSLDTRRPAYRPPTEEESYYTPEDTSMMRRAIAPGEFDFEPPIPSPVATPSTCAPVCPTGPSDQPGKKSPLQEQMHRELMQETMRSPGQIVKTSGTRTSRVCPHVIMTDEGPVEIDAQIITEKTLERSPTIETISKQIVGIAKGGPGEVRRTELDTERIEAPPSPPTPGQPLHEVISVSSSVAMAGDFKEITKTVTYEATKEKTGGAEAGGVNIAEVSRMVEEEAEEVDNALKLRPLELKKLSPGTYGVRKRAHELLINPSSVSRIEESVIYPLPNPDQEQEELQPELMASIMHSEERGIQLGAFPGQLCDMLFPDGKSDMVDVSSAAPAPLQDVVVPMEIPQKIHESAMNDELERAIIMVEQLETEKPKDSAYFEKVPAEKAAPLKNVAKRKKKKALPQEAVDLRAELPPWNADELKTVIDLVGAEPNSILIASAADEETLKELEKSSPESVPGIEYFLQLEPPTHISRVQLRGSTKPPWFPGYVLALPEFPEVIKAVKHPTAVINAAWQAVQPKVFPEDSILIA